MSLLPDKIVIITGASTGIGRAIALEAAKQGGHIVLHYLGERELSDAQDVAKQVEGMGRKIVLVPGDISLPQTAQKIVDTALSTFGRIDVLVSNAGICPFHSFLDMPDELWHRVRAVNMDGSFYITRAVANVMATQSPKGGSIVAVSSISALMGGAEQTHYTPTKAGIKSLMESCAIALGPMGIRCNSVLPGTIETNINKEDLSNPAKRADMSKRVPLGRLGVPEDLAGPAVFLASDMARYITGASLLVDGGMAISLQ